MTKIFCKYCKAPVVYGDERNIWIGYHNSWTHRTWWNIKKKLKGSL